MELGCDGLRSDTEAGWGEIAPSGISPARSITKLCTGADAEGLRRLGSRGTGDAAGDRAARTT